MNTAITCVGTLGILTIQTCSVLAFSGEVPSDGWCSGFEEAEARAKASGSTLLVHFYADWCGPCRRMERDVLNTPSIRSALGNGVVGVKVNSDRRKDLMRRFGITSLPTDIFLSGSGQLMGQHKGSTDRSRYLARVNRYRSESVMEERTSRLADSRDVATENGRVPRQQANGNTIPEDNRTQKTSSKSRSQQPSTVVQTAARTSSDRTASDAGHPPDATATQGSRPQTRSTNVRSAPAKSDVRLANEATQRRTPALQHDHEQKIGLRGYSPVSLSVEKKWVRGRSSFEHTFEGVRYRLRDAEELEVFRTRAKKFAPILHGYDPVSFLRDRKLEKGAIELGARYRGGLYFFASEANRAQFMNDPQPFSRPSLLTLSSVSDEETSGL